MQQLLFLLAFGFGGVVIPSGTQLSQESTVNRIRQEKAFRTGGVQHECNAYAKLYLRTIINAFTRKITFFFDEFFILLSDKL